nr:scopoletin glucosyltransferase-like [Ipomoea batatas]
MDTQSPPLHVYFLPLLAPGHMIPMVDLARQFARHGVKATFLTTPLNAPQISKSIDRERELGSQISLRLLEFPSKESGLPEGIENLSATTSLEQTVSFFNAHDYFQGPIESLAAEDRPDCIITGPMYTWSNDFAAKFGITRLSFWGTGFFPMCAHNSIRRHKPHEKIESDTEEFDIPELPDTLKITKKQIPEPLKGDPENSVNELQEKLMKGEEGSYGMVVNSFYELEPAYVKHFREVIGKKSWHVGPVSLCNKEDGEKSQRGQAMASIGEEECLNWLNSKTPNSVVYVCFGSMSTFSAAQLGEIAAGLEASGQPFIWVVKQNTEEWLPEGFEKSTQDRGLIIRGWAPQVLILDHEAVGGFMTHCGWNSLLEGVTAGVPMVTWPLSSEQFFNEKMATQILKIGVPVGVQAWTRRTDSSAPINRENIEIAVMEVMIGEEAEERRSRAIALGNMAKKAFLKKLAGFITCDCCCREEENKVETREVIRRHMLPMVDIARQFASHGVKATLLTTPLNAARISKTIQRDREHGNQITIRVLEFPYKESGLPEGHENLSDTTTLEQTHSFFNALDHFQRPVEQFVAEDRPDCIVAGSRFTWCKDLAAKFGITKLSFWGSGFFPMCAHHNLSQYKPHEKIESDSEEFIIPDLPDTLKMSKQQVPETVKDDSKNIISQAFQKIKNAEEESDGLVVNSFYELEPAYVRYWREIIGKKVWHIGPVSLCNKETHEKAHRGQAASIGEKECLDWLNSKPSKSVVYVCFGSMAIFSSAELGEIAPGLEASGQPFIWVVDQHMKEEEMKEWMPEGFEERMEGRGLIIRGWAPQLLILDHEAVGGFVTHCGWNSLIEGVAAGVPMVTWPLFSEQFFNEMLVTQILKIGVPVGARVWARRTDRRVPINRENIEAAVKELMAGEEAEERRSRAIALGNLAKKAVEPGGSSDADLSCLLEELKKNRK